MTPPNPAQRATAGWRAVVPLTLIILAGLLTIDCRDGTANSAVATPANATRTTSTPAEAAQASSPCVSSPTQPSDRFGPLHGYITYVAGTQIWAIDPNHPANRVSLGPSDGVSSMAWSRSGSRLLITEQSGSGDAGVTQDLCVMNGDGSATRLTSDGQSGVGSFSPDGATVVYARGDGLYVIEANGGTPRLIARSYMAWWLGSPAWSPDGSRIAYSVYLEGGPDPGIELWTVRPDGTDPHPLLHLAQCRAARDVGWSPDGSMLAFDTACGSGVGSPLYVVHADGSGLRQINDGVSSPSSASYGRGASWSPDGSRIAFIRDSGLFTMAADGSEVTQIEGTFANAYAGLAWNPVVRT